MRAFQGALGVAPEDGIVSPDYAVVRTSNGVEPRWLAEVMRTGGFVSQIVLRLRGIGGTDSGNVRTPRINVNDLLDIRVAIPSIEEQRADVSRYDHRTARVDVLIAKAQDHVNLAKELRVALITDAVTGRIDVLTTRKGA
jgi:type I restriction enzyme S subunit